MTSVGVMASAVVTGSCTSVLREAFNNLTAWTLNDTPTIVAGRTGTAVQMVSSGFMTADYTISAAAESDTVTIGFAYKVASLAFAVHPIILYSDAGATAHTTLRILADGSVAVVRGNQNGPVVGGGPSATGLVTANTWNYFELQVKLHDTAGAAIVRLNGTEIINASAVDTRNAGTKATYDRLRLSSQSTTNTTHQWDDLYLTTGPGCPFQGSITIP